MPEVGAPHTLSCEAPGDGRLGEAWSLVVCAPLGTQITQTTAQPDPDLGASRTHRRLDRPPAGSLGEGHRRLQARARPGSRRGSRLARRPTCSVPASTRTSPISGPRTRPPWPPRSRPSRTSPTRTRTTRRRPGRRRGRLRRRRRDDEDGEGSGQRRRRRGRRGGRGRGGRQRKALEGTFDHGEEGYGLWLDPAVQDDPVYAEHWRGHRPVTVTIEADRIVIERSGERRRLTAPTLLVSA